MNSANFPAELVVIVLNLIILMIAYHLLHPRMAGKDLHKLLINDVLSMLSALSVAGFLFWESEVKFSLLFFDVGWFGFSIITYSLLEIPFFSRYVKKHDIDLSNF